MAVCHETRTIIDEYNTLRYLCCNTLHRVGGPAVVHRDGTEEYYRHGARHRIDGPAVTHVDGTCEWWENGRRNRIDDPAVAYGDGSQEWWADGVRHRGGDQPAVVRVALDEREWWFKGKRHRAGGPAYTNARGDRRWYVDGVLHNDEGPALVEGATCAWYARGVMGRSQPTRSADTHPALYAEAGREEWWEKGQLLQLSFPDSTHADASDYRITFNARGCSRASGRADSARYGKAPWYQNDDGVNVESCAVM